MVILPVDDFTADYVRRITGNNFQDAEDLTPVEKILSIPRRSGCCPVMCQHSMFAKAGCERQLAVVLSRWLECWRKSKVEC